MSEGAKKLLDDLGLTEPDCEAGNSLGLQRNADETTIDAAVAPLVEALEPFAKFACEVAPGEEHDCHNCRAQKALEQWRTGR